MATFTGTRASKIFVPMGGGYVVAAYGSIAIGTAPVVADIYELLSLPAGAVVIGGEMWATDIDTNATETLAFTLGNSANGVEILADASLIAQAILSGDAVVDVQTVGKSVRKVELSSGPITFTRDTMIRATAKAIAATFTAGTLFARVDYFIP